MPEDELPYLALAHKQVSYLNIIPPDPEILLTEDTCLSDITFFPSGDRNTNDAIIGQDSPIEGDDILYMFQSGQTIRVNCNEIELVIG